VLQKFQKEEQKIFVGLQKNLAKIQKFF